MSLTRGISGAHCATLDLTLVTFPKRLLPQLVFSQRHKVNLQSWLFYFQSCLCSAPLAWALAYSTSFILPAKLAVCIVCLLRVFVFLLFGDGGIEPRALHMLDKCVTPELQPYSSAVSFMLLLI